MKILHLADLHLGKKLNDYSLIADQKYVLNQAVSLVENQRIEAVFICGDIFDRAVASSEALELFGDFIFDLNKLQVKIYIIAGNLGKILINKLYDSGIKSVIDTVNITPDVKASEAIIIFSFFFLNIKIVPSIVENPAKIVKVNANDILFTNITYKII